MTADPRDSSRLGTALLAAGMLLLAGGIVAGVLKYDVYNVLSDSMTATLHPGDRIVSDSAFDGGDGIRRGDIVMLDRAAWPDQPEHAELVKRVVAVGGDTIGLAAGNRELRLNGRVIVEEYLPDGVDAGSADFSVRVPRDQVFVLGDNRPGSVDSRPDRGKTRGPVPASAIRGRVVAVGFPLDRIGSVPSTSAFGPSRGSETALLLVVGAVAAGLALLLAAGAETLRFRRRHR